MKKIIDKIAEKAKYYYLKSKISIVGNYGMKDLQSKEEIIIGKDISLNDIKNFIYIKDNSKIKFSFDPTYNYENELSFYQKLTEIFKILEQHEKIYNITIRVENRELFKQSKAIEHTKNINLTIINDLDEYTKEEFIESEKILDDLIEPIKKSNLSPYEKYLAVYNIVKQYKTYKDNITKKSEARSLKNILTNEYIVCVGFATLLTTLLDRVGIPSIPVSALVEDTSFNLPFLEEYKCTILGGHKRNIIKIDDDKYNIHGIYLVDPTWDNNLEVDLYNNATLTFDKLKESTSLEAIKRYDYLLDAHTFDEYQEKINHYLIRETRMHEKEKYLSRIKKGYRYTYKDTLKLLYKLDNKKYQELSNKYKIIIDSINESTSFKEIEEIYSKFLTEYGYYIIELSNKEISIEITLEAATNVKRIIDGYNDEEIKKWLNITKQIYEDVEEVSYPYLYNKDSKIPNYLEAKPKKRVKTK